MVVHDQNVVSVVTLPAEADPPLSVDADAELPLAIARQSLEPVARRPAQILQATRSPEDLQSLLRLLPKGTEAPDPPALVERFGVPVGEALDHP
jgi:hypothetical protein